MGTNYYMRRNCCDKCGRYDELHIGKQAVGWRFLFRGYRDLGVLKWEDMKRAIETSDSVRDEYGSLVEKDEMIRRIERTAWNHSLRHHSDDLSRENFWLDHLGSAFLECDFS